MPEHYFDVGIAEQQAVLFAAGLALAGRQAGRARSTRPSCSARSTRSSTTSASRSLNVVFAMDRAGLVGDDGPTHHGAFDIAYLRCLPNIVADGAARRGDARAHAAHRAEHDDGPVALRYPRGEGVGVAAAGAAREPIEIGTGEILREGERVALVGYGTGVGKALEAADLLAERGLEVTVADARFAKPLDAGAAGAARGRARAARDRRGGRPRRRLRLRRVGDAHRRRRAVAARSCASACPTATSRTASRRCCTREVGFTGQAHRRAHRGRGQGPARLAGW